MQLISHGDLHDNLARCILVARCLGHRFVKIRVECFTQCRNGMTIVLGEYGLKLLRNKLESLQERFGPFILFGCFALLGKLWFMEGVIMVLFVLFRWWCVVVGAPRRKEYYCCAFGRASVNNNILFGGFALLGL